MPQSPPTFVAPDVACLASMSNDLAQGATSSTLALETSALRVLATLVPWDTESFGAAVAQLQHIEVRDRLAADADMQGLVDWFARQGVDLASCRLDHSKLLESAALERVGFRFIEMVYSMQIDTLGTKLATESQPAVHWRKACETDVACLQQLAADAFATGRWNIDWGVGQALGGRRYADWVVRSLADPRHEVLCAIVDGDIAGLFITEPGVAGRVYWHLTAVSPAWQGRGLGKAMWTSMLGRHAAEGSTHVDTTISARNVPVVNLYAKLGWRFVDCQMTYHWASARWLARGG